MGICNIGGKDGYLRKSIADKLVSLGVTVAKAYDTAAQFVANIQTAVTQADTAGYNRGVSATKQGTASEGQVLNGYTFTNQSGFKNGSMPNRGALNWNPSTNTTYTVPAGYYSGGTLNSANAYNAGKSLAKNVVRKQVSANLSRPSGSDNCSASISIDSGYTLYKTLFPVVVSNSDWNTTASQSGESNGQHWYSFEQQGNTIVVTGYRTTYITIDLYYLNNP